MNALVISFFAALLAALSNWFFRKNIHADSEQPVSGYLLFFYLCGLIFSLVILPNVPFHLTPLLIGGLVGIANITMMILTAKALEIGPSGLTFAFQNASSIFPGIILFLVLGVEFGFSISLRQGLGIMLILIGLFLGARGNSEQAASGRWFKYAVACLLVQIVALTFIQARSVLFDGSQLSDFFTRFAFSPEEDAWFLPGFYGTAVLLQGLIMLLRKQSIKPLQILLGSCGGLSNLASTVLLLVATTAAVGYENAIILPFFAISTIILCNIWASWLYFEKFNYLTNGICALGIFVGSIT